jgi:hypothetical protein
MLVKNEVPAATELQGPHKLRGTPAKRTFAQTVQQRFGFIRASSGLVPFPMDYSDF